MQAQDRSYIEVAFFPVLSRMLSSYQLYFLVFVVAQLVESLYHSTDEEHSLDRFSSDSRCGWDCIITESNFSGECHDPVFTKKRLTKLKLSTTCLSTRSASTKHLTKRLEISLMSFLYGYRQIKRFLAFLTELKACGIWFFVALREEKSEDFAT